MFRTWPPVSEAIKSKLVRCDQYYLWKYAACKAGMTHSEMVSVATTFFGWDEIQAQKDQTIYKLIKKCD